MFIHKLIRKEANYFILIIILMCKSSHKLTLFNKLMSKA